MEIYARPGDSLWYYSQLFGIPLFLIQQSNPQLPESYLPVATKVRIPGFTTAEHQIESGDSLWELSVKNHIPLNTMTLLNPSVNPQNLQMGQMILIPQPVTDFIVSDANHYTYEKMMADFRRLQVVYPFIFTQKIGSSVMGKDIVEITIGAGNKRVHLDGSFHANEWITTPVIIRFLNHYAMSLTNNSPIRGISMLPLYMDTSLSLVPMVNPDGVNLVLDGSSATGTHQTEVLKMNNGSENFTDWKANIRGVDLNNQYPARWEIEAERKPTSPAPRDYPGPYPLSEPEAIALADLARSRDFSRVNAFHTQGKEIYWGFEGYEPAISEAIVAEYARVSGYEPIRYVDSYAGYKDWFIQDFRRPGFTIELGNGVNPLPIEQFPEIYEESLGIMLANLYM